MNKWLLALALASVPSLCAASLFSFQDLDGYEKCLSTEGIEEISTEGSRTEKKWLGGMDLKERCIKQAVAIASKISDTSKLLEMVDLTRRQVDAALALPLAQALASKQLSACNDMKVYGILLTTLRRPTTKKVAQEDFEEARKLVSICSKNSTFKSDFLEEAANSDTFIRANACRILKDAKLLKSCPEPKK
jgi:hypothetical protein